MHAYSVKDDCWREITTGATPAAMAWDQNGDLILYDATDTAMKVYSAIVREDRGFKLRTKTIALDEDERCVVRSLSVTYKSASALAVRVFLDNGVVSGEIRPGIEYVVAEVPYIDGEKYKVTYLGVEKKHGQTITGITGITTFTESGSGVLCVYDAMTLPANTFVQTKQFRIAERAKKMFVEIEDAVASTTETEIHRITLHFD